MQLSGAGVRGVIVDRERERGGSLPFPLSLDALETYRSCFACFKGTKGGEGCVCVWERERARERRWQLSKFELDWDSMQNEREDISC